MRAKASPSGLSEQQWRQQICRAETTVSTHTKQNAAADTSMHTACRKTQNKKKKVMFLKLDSNFSEAKFNQQ